MSKKASQSRSARELKGLRSPPTPLDANGWKLHQWEETGWDWEGFLSVLAFFRTLGGRSLLPLKDVIDILFGLGKVRWSS